MPRDKLTVHQDSTDSVRSNFHTSTRRRKGDKPEIKTSQAKLDVTGRRRQKDLLKKSLEAARDRYPEVKTVQVLDSYEEYRKEKIQRLQAEGRSLLY